MTQKEKKTMPVKLAQELNSRQCADLVKALDEISDLNLLNYVLTDVRRKRQRCDEKGIRFDDLCSRSYFSPEDLSMIEQGVYSLLDTLDIEHLIELAGLSSLAELMRE